MVKHKSKRKLRCVCVRAGAYIHKFYSVFCGRSLKSFISLQACNCKVCDKNFKFTTFDLSRISARGGRLWIKRIIYNIVCVVVTRENFQQCNRLQVRGLYGNRKETVRKIYTTSDKKCAVALIGIICSHKLKTEM